MGLLLSVGIALFQFWDDKFWIFVTAGIFLFGQFVEGNILSPNLIGKSVGLHPVWLILALSVFGALFGFTGLLVAVPVAAALGVIGRFLVEQYRRARSTPASCRRRTAEPWTGRGSWCSTCRRGRRWAREDFFVSPCERAGAGPGRQLAGLAGRAAGAGRAARRRARPIWRTSGRRARGRAA